MLVKMVKNSEPNIEEEALGKSENTIIESISLVSMSALGSLLKTRLVCTF